MTVPEGVVTIGDYVFYNCEQLTSVTLPDTLTDIGDYVFYNCEQLASVTLPDTLTDIGDYVFYDCKNLKTVQLPKYLTAIPREMFNGCESLTEIIIPETVTSIGNSVFFDCYGLTSIEIPKNVTSIGDSAFIRCTSLKEIDIPDSVTSIGEYAFSQCHSLSSFTFPKGITNISDSVLKNCEKLVEVHIPEGVLSISKEAFIHCKMLKKADIPSTVTEIGEYAFAYTNLGSSVDIPSGVKIADMAFAGAFDGLITEVWFMGDLPICEGTPFSCFDEEYNNVPITGFYPADNLNWTHKNVYENGIQLINKWYPYTINENGNRVVDWNGWMPSGYAPAAESTHPTEETIPETTVAEETVPETTVAETTPETTTPVETVAETVPETTEPTVPEITAETESVVETQPEETEAGETLLSALLSPFTVQASAAEVEIPNPEAPEGVFGGEYGAEDVGTYTLRTATFYDLVPGEQYVLLDMVSISGSDPLTASNLLSIDQGTADSSGTLVFEYVQRQDYTSSYIVACGPSNQDLNEAFVIFPHMEATGELQAINPTVDYYGDTLKEGQDYVLLGQVSFEEVGEYTCFVRGINQYTGLVKCTYTVGGPMRGDFNADEKVDEQDAIYLIWHTLFPETYPIKTTGDMNRDGKTNDTDAAYLLWHILFPETYPL